MNDVADMQVVDAHQQVAKEAQHFRFVKMDCLPLPELDQFVKGPVWRVLHHYVHDFVATEHHEEAYDAGMVQLGQNENLAHHTF